MRTNLPPSLPGEDPVSRSCLAALFEYAPDAILVYPLDEHQRPAPFLDANPAAASLTGYSREELKKLTESDLLDPIDSVELRTEALLRDGFLVEESLLVTRAGTRIPIEARARLTRLDGQLSVIATWQNIDERKRQERELARLAAIVENSNDAIIAHSLEGLITQWNQGAEKLFGYSVQEAAGQSLQMLIPPERAGEERRILELLGRGEHVEQYHTERIRKDGQRIDVSVAVSPIRDRNSRIIAASSIERDITGRIRAAEALRKLNETLEQRVEQRTRSLQRYARELEQKNESLQQFAYVASHDLKEPLRMVISYLQLLDQRYREKLDEEAREFIHFAVDGAQRMQQLIEALLAYSRVSTHARPFEEVDTEQLAKRAVLNLKVAIDENRARVRIDPLPMVRGDPLQLTQLFQNLIGNAIKFRRNQPPEIHVGADSGNEEWIFWVQDNGIGIDTKYAEQVFMIFKRLHNREQYGGTGIGLAICKTIVERHGGRIWYESSSGTGTTFFFTIPMHGNTSSLPMWDTDELNPAS